MISRSSTGWRPADPPRLDALQRVTGVKRRGDKFAIDADSYRCKHAFAQLGSEPGSAHRPSATGTTPVPAPTASALPADPAPPAIESEPA